MPAQMLPHKSGIDTGGPYKAMRIGIHRWWWYVQDKTGLNVLSFLDKPGAVYTTEADAKAIADSWNAAE